MPLQTPPISSRIKSFIPILQWMPAYSVNFLKWDVVAGITLASFVLPESMAYATLAGVPAYYGIYCCLVGGLFFALFTSSKHVAIGPTSAISLMIGSTVAAMAAGDTHKWLSIVSLVTLSCAAIYFIAFLFRLSSLVNFISDSILLGFKAGAALSIISTQLPKLFGIEGGGGDFFSRIWNMVQHLPQTNIYVLGFGLLSLFLLLLGDRLFPGKPISIIVVILSIIVLSVTGWSQLGIRITGAIPGGLPSVQLPSFNLQEINGVLELAFACCLMGYIESISAAKTFASKNGYDIDPRQELFSLSMANIAATFFSAYVVSGGLSQSTVNEKSGAKTPMSLIVCSFTLCILLLCFTGLLHNLPEVILAVIVVHAVAGLIRIKELKRMYYLSKLEFGVALIAVIGVLTFGILKGVMIAVVGSLVFLIIRISRPHVAVLGRIGNTDIFSDIERHPDNTTIPGILILRIEASILYFNAEHIQDRIKEIMEQYPGEIRMVILDLSPSFYVDVSGSSMLLQLSEKLKLKGIPLKIVEALSTVRDILRKQGMEEVIGKISRKVSIQDAIEAFNQSNKSLD
ncbi:MAG: SulP family inorganic anion transporter [Sphingobacteriia bacterium]|nr:SulP family inorganic anion transporter [Sphingobacteriia bacterium]